MKKVVGLFALLAVVLFSSCLKGDNERVLNSMIGTVEALQISGITTPVLMVRLDVDNEMIKLPITVTDYKAGDRVIVSFRINFDNQPSDASKNGYYEVSDLHIERIQTLASDVAPTEQLPNDAILQVTRGYMKHTVGDPQRYMFTISGYINSGVNGTHDFQLYQLPLNTSSDNDTLRYELRHNKNGDVENQLTKEFIYSFDCSREMSSLKVSEKKLIIELTYWNKQGFEVVERLSFQYPKY